jgi:TolA-binding protein
MSKAFREYYTKYPDDEKAAFAYYYDAWARYRMGKWEEASGVFAELAAKYPRSPFAAESVFRAGDAIFNMRVQGREETDRKWQKAMAYYQQVAQRHPDSEYVDDALYNEAWCLINLERAAEAVPIFERIVARYADGRYGPRSQFTLGDYYYGLKDYPNATASYKRFLELFPEEKLRSGDYDPKDRGLAQKAQIYLANLAEIDAYNLYSQGEQLFDEKRYDEAVAIFVQVREQYPQSGQAVNAKVNIGAVHLAREEYRAAGTVFQEVIEEYSEMREYSAQVDFARQQLEALQEARVL